MTTDVCLKAFEEEEHPPFQLSLLVNYDLPPRKARDRRIGCVHAATYKSFIWRQIQLTLTPSVLSVGSAINTTVATWNHTVPREGISASTELDVGVGCRI